MPVLILFASLLQHLVAALNPESTIRFAAHGKNEFSEKGISLRNLLLADNIQIETMPRKEKNQLDNTTAVLVKRVNSLDFPQDLRFPMAFTYQF